MAAHSVDLGEFMPQLEAVDLLEPSSDEDPEVVEAPVPPRAAPRRVPRDGFGVSQAAVNKELKRKLHRSHHRRMRLQDEVDVARAADREMKIKYNTLVAKYNALRAELNQANRYGTVVAEKLAEATEKRDEYCSTLHSIAQAVQANVAPAAVGD